MNTPNPVAPRTIVQRSARSRRITAPTEAMSAGYASRVFGASGGIARYSTIANTTSAAAAAANTVRQPAASAISPLSVRDTRMPVRMPDTTIPTTRPRWASSARSPASGVSSCPATVVSPSTVIATSRTMNDGASAQPTRATAAQAIIAGISRRRLTTSPSGTTSRIPAA